MDVGNLVRQLTGNGKKSSIFEKARIIAVNLGTENPEIRGDDVCSVHKYENSNFSIQYFFNKDTMGIEAEVEYKNQIVFRSGRVIEYVEGDWEKELEELCIRATSYRELNRHISQN